MPDPTQRFSTRVENYIKYRPSYPAAALDHLSAACGLTAAAVIVDIGSGTGILTRLFLERGQHVYGVEPNRAMRAAGERLLAGYDRFVSIAGTAEATNLPAGCADCVTAGQAFHWFDRARCRAEFGRILKPGGWVVLIWNSRRKTATPFLDAYERILQTYATDYTAVDHSNVGAAEFEGFFGAHGYRLAAFPNEQRFDYDGLAGRLLSSSYAPEPGHPNHAPMLAGLRAAFDAHQVGGRVVFEYGTEVVYGRV